jgi:cyclopropane fatty-acyl-phospholipid synthase-like methyltransferase
MSSEGNSINSLKPGDRHYRAYVGPPDRYDLIAALSFNLLTAFLGLREHHRVLDVGCGSLRTGRLLIPYLSPGMYVGLEPERWLVAEGITHECGQHQIDIKKPTFIYSSDWSAAATGRRFDFILAQSIFSHAAKEEIRTCLRDVVPCMHDDTIMAATFVLGDNDYDGTAWVYPGIVRYKENTIDALVASAGLVGVKTAYTHPKQTWYLIGRNAGLLNEINGRIERCATSLFTGVRPAGAAGAA